MASLIEASLKIAAELAAITILGSSQVLWPLLTVWCGGGAQWSKIQKPASTETENTNSFKIQMCVGLKVTSVS